MPTKLFRYRLVLALAPLAMLVGCSSSNSDRTESGTAAEPAVSSEPSIDNSAGPATFQSQIEKSTEAWDGDGNGGRSLGDMRANAFARCINRYRGDLKYEETCNAEGARLVQSEGTVTDAKGRMWKTIDNEYGAVVFRGKIRYFLGNSCDVRSSEGLIGRWKKEDLDSFVVILPSERVEFKGSVLDALKCLNDK